MEVVEGALHLLGVLAVFHGRNALDFAENLGEVAQGGEAQELCNLGHGKIGLGQQVLAFLQTAEDQVIDGGDAILPLECVGQIVFIHVPLLRQLVQSQRFLEVQVDVPADGGALAVGGDCLGMCWDGQGGAAHEPDDENLHIGLAHILVAGAFHLHFPEDISQAAGDLHAFKLIQDAELSVGCIAGLQLNAVDTQDDVLQRLGVQAYLRMGDIGVDDHQIIGAHRMELILDEKLPFSADDIEQFQMVVGVGYAVPVAAILGTGHI